MDKCLDILRVNLAIEDGRTPAEDRQQEKEKITYCYKSGHTLVFDD